MIADPSLPAHAAIIWFPAAPQENCGRENGAQAPPLFTPIQGILREEQPKRANGTLGRRSASPQGPKKGYAGNGVARAVRGFHPSTGP